jgi:hydrogenase nickel incorporation protein HypA/HybF
MHEMSLAAGILQLVEDAAARESFSRVARLRLECGKLAGVEVSALRFALEAVSPGTCLEGARIEVDEPPGQAWCMPCAENIEIQARGDPCPRCGGWQLVARGGDRLRVVDLRVTD